MVRKAEELYREALALSDEERDELIRLLATQRDSSFASAEIEQAWMKEIARREKMHAEGKMGSVSWEQLKRDLFERESARRLAHLGGSEPGLKNTPRRRSDVE